MTTATGYCNAAVIEGGVSKVAGGVAFGALLLCRQVVVALADSDNTIMASIATADIAAGMVKHTAGEGAWCVANRAILAGDWQVIEWRTHSGVTMAAVTAFTHYGRAAVIDKSVRKIRCVMTGRAIDACNIWMIGDIGQPGRIHIVMTRGAGLGYRIDHSMIKYVVQIKGLDAMADIAF
jgi:hypothetical protein